MSCYKITKFFLIKILFYRSIARNSKIHLYAYILYSLITPSCFKINFRWLLMYRKGSWTTLKYLKGEKLEISAGILRIIVTEINVCTRKSCEIINWFFARVLIKLFTLNENGWQDFTRFWVNSDRSSCRKFSNCKNYNKEENSLTEHISRVFFFKVPYISGNTIYFPCGSIPKYQFISNRKDLQ